MTFRIYLLGAAITFLLTIIAGIIDRLISKGSHVKNRLPDYIVILLLTSISWGGLPITVLAILNKCLNPNNEKNKENENKNEYLKLD